MKFPCKLCAQSKAILKLVRGLGDTTPAEGTVHSEQTVYCTSINPSGLGASPKRHSAERTWSRCSQSLTYCHGHQPHEGQQRLEVTFLGSRRFGSDGAYEPIRTVYFSPNPSVSSALVVSTQGPPPEKAGTSSRVLLLGRGHVQERYDAVER